MNENTMLVPQMGINMEQATANCEELAKAIREMTAGVLTTVNSFCRWIRKVAAEVAAQQEMETALRQFRVIGGALVPVQLFAVLASP